MLGGDGDSNRTGNPRLVSRLGFPLRKMAIRIGPLFDDQLQDLVFLRLVSTVIRIESDRYSTTSLKPWFSSAW